MPIPKVFIRIINYFYKIINVQKNKIKNFYRKNFKKFNALKNLDQKMLKYINYFNGFYIEMGAHDGIFNSNTYYYEKNLNWNGILIEPSNQFKYLIKNRSKKNFFFNFACAEFKNIEKHAVLFGNADYSFLKDFVDDNFSSWYQKKQKIINKKLYSKKIKLRTLNSILIESDAPKLIDFFSLDVEGMELKVLKGIDFNIFNFKYLLVECVNNEKYLKISSFLFKKKYIHIDSLTPWDHLFKFKISTINTDK